MLEGAGNCDFAIRGAKTEADDSKLKALVHCLKCCRLSYKNS